MRTTAQRIWHAIAFEIIGLILIVFILTRFGFDATHTGVIGVVFSLIATGWNYFYNILFDKGMLKYTGQLEKTHQHRLLHALIFEFGLLIVTLPILAFWFNISLFKAFIMDIGLVIFYLFYAYIFNLLYDKLFPIKQSLQK